MALTNAQKLDAIINTLGAMDERISAVEGGNAPEQVKEDSNEVSGFSTVKKADKLTLKGTYQGRKYEYNINKGKAFGPMIQALIASEKDRKKLEAFLAE